MERSTVYLVTGLPGAGKTGLVERMFGQGGFGGGFWGIVPPRTALVRFDSIRLAMGHTYHAAAEAMVTAVACAMIRAALHDGCCVVVDESVTEIGKAHAICDVVDSMNATLRIFHLDTPALTCRERRIPNGFPEEDFSRKVVEWTANGPDILKLGDIVTTIIAEECEFRGVAYKTVGRTCRFPHTENGGPVCHSPL